MPSRAVVLESLSMRRSNLLRTACAIASRNSSTTASTTEAIRAAANEVPVLTVAQFSAHAVINRVTSAMAAQVHDLSGKPGMVPRTFGTQTSALAITSGPGRANRGRAWLAYRNECPSERVSEEESTCRL
ncbi:PE family protein [Mycobacterium noviomagense]|uniref:PE family protein n=1 Tax=Mycobacterium noviomagense TaxID=459858 RepID=UPI0009F18DBA